MSEENSTPIESPNVDAGSGDSTPVDVPNATNGGDTAPAVEGGESTPAAEPAFKFKLGDDDTAEYGSEDDLKADLSFARQHREQIEQYQARAKEYDQQAANLENLVQQLKADPYEVLRQLGHDPKQLAYNALQDDMARAAKVQQMTEDERKAFEVQERIANQQAEIDRYREAEQARIAEAEAKAQYDRLTAEATQLTAELGLEYTPEIEHFWAAALQSARYENPHATLKDVQPRVQQAIATTSKAFMNVPPEQFASMMGKDFMETLRKYMLQTAQGGAAPKPQPKAQPKAKAEPKVLSEIDYKRIFGL